MKKAAPSTWIPLLICLSLMVVMTAMWQLNPPEDEPPAATRTTTAAPKASGDQLIPTALTQEKTTTVGPLADFDSRIKGDSGLVQMRSEALDALRQEIPGVSVDFDPVSKSPKWIASNTRMLTDAHTGPDADAPIRNFIDAHRAVFGHGSEALEAARRVTDYSTERGPSRKVVWHQQHEGIDVFEAVLQANLTPKSELINIGSQFIPDAPAAANATVPALAVEEAVAAAGQNVGEKMTAASVRAMGPAAEQPDRRQQFRAALLTDADAKLTWVPMNENTMRLAWDVTLTSRSRAEMYRVLVDAETSDVLVRQALTAYISDATYRVFTTESPTPFSPGHESASSLQPAQVDRVLLTTPGLNTTASPNGWINDGGNITSGNNADAYTDTNADNVADLPRTTGSPDRVFDFPLDLTQEPVNFKDASVTQLFYWTNFMHDRMYELGFTEAAGNFQADNFGRGGLGNDPVNAEAQDGSGTNNANFSTPVDGGRGRMQMFNWTSPAPDRDGSFEAEVVLHEYGHGVSNRLVGGPSVSISSLSTRGMGEGWSDFLGLALTAQSTDNPHGNWARGAWSRYLNSGWMSENYYYGARRYSYSTDMLKNPLTLKDIDPTQVDWHVNVPRNPTYAATQDATQVHYQGTVWSVTLWELRANLILKHGFAVGNDRAMFLVLEGMKLSPANPSFIQARDGIIQATLVNHPTDLGEVWTAFAKRGMGDGATAPASTTTTGIVESYAVPDGLEISDRSGWNITGNKGGPFSPATKTLTLSNDGASSINWNSSAAAWLSVSPASGTLAPGANVIVTITTQADLVEPGFHSTNLVFSNTGSGFNQPVGVRLYVTPPVAVSFDLNTDPGWSTSGEWAYGTPSGSGGSGSGGAGNADPSSGATGSNVFGVNLAGNAATAVGGPFYLTSTPVDLSARKTTRLRFKRWLNTNVLSSTRTTVEVSTDGTNWREVFVNPGTAIADNAWQTMEYDISSIADQQPSVQVRWSYRNLTASSAYSGWNIDDVEFLGESTAQFTLDVAATVSEAAGPLTGTLNLNLAQDAPVTVTLTSSDLSAATVEPSVTLAAGELTKTFTITPVNDGDLDGMQTTLLTASAAGIGSGTHSLQVEDDETAILTLSAPANVAEGTLAVAGSVSVSSAPVRDVVVPLSSNNPALVVPASVVIPAGSTGPVAFNFDAPDNAFAEGIKNVTLTAAVANWTNGTANVAVSDDEVPTILLTGPDALREGDAPQTYTVTVNTIQATDLTLDLASDDLSEITVPATVTIASGESSATFVATVVDDALADGAQPVTLSAGKAGYVTGTRSVNVADNELNHYTFATISSPQKRNKPIGLTLTARDINGAVITNHSGSVNLTSSSAGGPVPFSPATLDSFIDGVATRSITVTATATSMVLTALDAGGKTGASNAFDVETVTHDTFAWSGLPTSINRDVLFNATATAVDDAGATVPDYADATDVDLLMAVFERTIGSSASSTTTDKVYNTAFHDSRTQIIYTASDLGNTARWIGMLFLSRSTTGGQAMLNFTVRAKMTDRADFDGGGWEEDDWTTVYSISSFAASSTIIPFIKPFYYDGVRNLMIDVSFNNTSASTPGLLRTVVSSSNRVLSGVSDSAHGDPLSWTDATGPTPVLSGEVPTVSVYDARSYGPIPASPATFVNGEWLGQAFAPTNSGSYAWLRATAPSGVTGTSDRISILGPSTPVGTETVFSDGFETGALSASWNTTGNSGSTARTQVTSANTPKTGTFHLTMDTTSTGTGTFARNSPTLTLNLAGRTNVSLEWFQKEFLDDNHPPTLTGPLGTFSSSANYDGVAISQDGITWHQVAPMTGLLSSYSTAVTRVALDPVIQRLGWSYNSNFRLRFSQYDDQAIPNDGIAIDDVAVKANPANSIRLSLPPTIAEGTLNVPVTVTLPSAPASNTSVTLLSNANARLTVVSPVVVLAGQTTATTSVSALQNSYTDVGKEVIITALATGQTTSYSHIRVVDDEQPTLALILPPSVTEGGASGTGTVTISPLSPANQVLYLTSSNTAEATVVSNVTILAGRPSATFSILPVNDTRLDGTQTVTITASGLGMVSGDATIDVLDNESTVLAISPPGTLQEGGSFGVATVTLSGPRTVDTIVSLNCSDETEATFTSGAVIPAGQTSANVQVFPVDDAIQDGSQTVTLTASADGFTDGTVTFEVQDNDPAVFEFGGIASPQTRNAPFTVTITARDENGGTVGGFQGTIALTALGDAGVVPVTTSSPVTFVNGSWTGEIMLGAADTNIILTATGGDGATGNSDPFGVITGGSAVALAFTPVSNPHPAGAAIPVIVRAVDAAGILVNEVNGPVTVELVTSPGNTIITTANLTLVNGATSVNMVIPAPLPAVFLRGTAGALTGQSAVFELRTVEPLAYPPPEVVFSDDFEATSFKPEWTISGTGTHRTIITTANGPRTGSRHMTMDSNTDGPYARNEATLTLNLAGKSDVELSFWMKESGDEDNGPPALPFIGGADFDGVAISTDGNTWYEVQGLRSTNGISSTYTQFKLNLDSAAATHGLTLNSTFGIRFNHYDNFTYGSDGFAFDDISVTANAYAPEEPVASLYEEDFETGVFGPEWQITGTGNHRTQITNQQTPRDNFHMLMDAYVSGLLSRNEATLSLDLTGQQDVTLKFWMKEIGDEDHGPPAIPFIGGADFDGVAVSTDGNTWYQVKGLRGSDGISANYTEFTVDLSEAATTYGLSIGPGFKVRFNHYDDFPITSDGFAFDDISVTGRPVQQLVLNAPTTVAEGGSTNATITLPAARAVDTVVALTTNRPDGITLPATITIPAGDTVSAQFVITSVEESLLTGNMPVQIVATTEGYRRGVVGMTILDNEAPAGFGLSLPAALAEGGSIDGTVSMSAANLFDLPVALSASPAIGLTHPPTVTLTAGTTSASFTLAKPENDIILEPSSTTISATAGAASDSAVVSLTDNDAVVPLVITLPASALESSNPVSGSVGFAAPTVVGGDLVVTLFSSDTASLTVPATVTIPAGAGSITFDVTPVDNALSDGARNVTVTASATGVSGDTHDVNILDDEVHHFAFDSIASPQVALQALSVTIHARSIDNQPVTNFSGTASLSASNAGGSVSVTPASTGTFVNGTWTGQVTFSTPAAAVTLAADATGGITGSSNVFDVDIGPRLAITPSSISITLPEHEAPTVAPLSLTNTGTLPLNWNAEVLIHGVQAEPPLTSVLTRLNDSFAAIAALVPNRYDFADGVTGTNISDGGGDMYDNGNYLSTNISTAGTYLNYSDNVIASSINLGSGGQYFTRKHPGLFVFAADIAGLSHFEIAGNLGANSSGATDTAILTSTRDATTYKGFVKRVYNAGDPSVNHLIIVQDDPALTRTASTNTDSDQHRLSGLGAVTRIYYLLYASSSGGYIDDTQTQAIMEAFLDSITARQWLTLASSSGSIPAAGSATLDATFRPTGMPQGVHSATLRFTSNDPTQPQLDVPATLTITPGVHHFGWSAIPSAQATNVPFAATLTAQDAANATITNFNGTASLQAFGPAAETTTGTGTLTTTFPFSANSYYELRTQSIYTQAEVGTAGRIQSIALDVTALPSILTDFTIRLKHTTKVDYSGTGNAVWESSGWTTVYKSNLTIPATGWLTLPLATPFDYDGTSRLMVDISFDNASYGTSGSVRYSSASSRVIYSGQYGSSGAPVTWGGTSPSPFTSSSLVNLRFVKRLVFPVAPSSATFANGVWNGTPAVGKTGAQISLVATHSTRPAVIGESGIFAVTSLGSLGLSIPGTGTEGSTLNATVTASVAPTSDLTVTLASSAAGVASPPASVTIPAGQTSASFTLDLPEDALLDGTQTALISASAPFYDSAQATAAVNDNDSTTVTLTLPATLVEGTSSTTGQASVQIATPAAADLTITLSSSLTSRLTVPASVIIPSGQTSADFMLTAPNNGVIDGDQDAVVTATLNGSTPASGTVQVTDNESRALSFVQFTTSISEGGSPSTTAGYISLAGSVTAPLTISLSSSDTSELNISTTVTVPAGSSSSGYFVLTPANDTDLDGTQTVTLTASAPTFTSGTRTVSVLDDDAHHFTVSTVAGTQVRNAPFNVTFTAKDINNITIAAYAGSPVLTAQDGATALGVTPTTVTGFSSGVKTQSVTVQNEAAAAVLTLTDETTAATGSSNAFVVGAGSLHHFTWDTISSPKAADTPFNASISARDAFENLVTGYSDPVQLTAAENYNVTTAGTGTTSDWYPFGGYYPQNRCQMIYTQAEAGGVARKLQALAFDMTTPSVSYPAVTLTNFTIRLKHTTKTDYNTSAVWESDDWTTVYQGTVNMNQTGWRQFNFTTPFNYNGTDRLMVDISSSQAGFRNRIEARSSFVSPSRALYSFTSSATPPTQWTGAGGVASYLPNLRLISFDPVAVTPSQTTAFTGGLWNGAISLATPGSIVAMAMDSATGVSGNSNAFTISSLGPLTLSLPVSTIGEADGTITATLSVGAAQGADIIVALTSTKPATAATVPASVTIPAGQTSVTFPVTVVNDTLLDGTQTTLITATAPGYDDGSTALEVQDDETTTISLTLPATLAENAVATTGTVTLGAPAGTDVTLPLTSSDMTELVVPADVTILAGSTSATFTITPVDDAAIDLAQTVTVNTSMTGWTGGSTTIQITDDETASFSLSFTNSVNESTGVLTGTVTTPVAVENATIVTLASADTTEATIPATATIAAGSSSTTFPITVIDDIDKDGSQTFAITAAASGFITGTRNLTVTDNDVHNFLISAIGATQIRNSPFNVTFTARDVNNVTITGYSGSPLLTANDGATALTVTPATISGFSAGVKTQSVTVGSFASSAMLTLTDPVTGGSGTSSAFVVTFGPLSRFAWNSIPQPQVMDVAFPVTITAQDAAGNPVTSYTGSAALSAPAGSTTLNVGTGSVANLAIPFNALFTKCRSQQVHLASEIGATGQITSLAVNLTAVPTAITFTDFTIRLKHTSRTGYTLNLNDLIWETDGFTTVYQGTVTVSSTGYHTFTFTTPFTYDGVSNLMVDYSYNMASLTTTNRPTVSGTDRGGRRSINYYTSATTYGEPLTWNGISPPAFGDSRITDIQLGVVTSFHPLSPASTSAFTNGIWSGNLAIGSTVDLVTVTASDAALSGRSNSFEVIPTPFVLAAEPAFTGGMANTLAWNLPATGLEYEVERSATPDFSSPVSSGFLAGSTTTFGGLVDGQTYHYRARMRRQGALSWTSDWSTAISSTQDATPPTVSAPELTTTGGSGTLAGTATDATSGVASVMVNGNAAASGDAFATWTRTLTSLSDGPNSFTVTASDNAVPPNTTTITTTVYRIANPGTDDNHDGIDALLEHALGIPSDAPNRRSMLPTATVQTDSGTGDRYLTMQFRRRIQHGGLSYVVETSDNLTQWDNTGASVQEVSTAPTGDGVTELVTVRVTPAMGPSNPNGFVRLRVSSN